MTNGIWTPEDEQFANANYSMDEMLLNELEGNYAMEQELFGATTPTNPSAFQQLGQGLGGGLSRGIEGIRGIGDYFLKPKTYQDPNTQQAVVGKSRLGAAMPLLKFGLNMYQQQQQQQLMEDMQKESKLQNRRSILGTITSQNRNARSNEYNRLRMQGLSNEQAMAGADQFISERGLTAEQFGVKSFGNNTTVDYS